MVVAVFAPERRGGTNEIAVSVTAVCTNRLADANGLGQRSCEGGGHHRCERGHQARDGEPAVSDGVARQVRHRDYSEPSAGSRSGSPSRGNWSSWKMTISVIAPPVMRRTSIVSGRYASSCSRQR